jgi:hypothetical protein
MAYQGRRFELMKAAHRRHTQMISVALCLKRKRDRGMVQGQEGVEAHHTNRLEFDADEGRT